MRKLRICIAVFLLYGAAASQDYGKVTMSQAADGVYLFRTARYGDVGFGGNVVAIVGKNGIALFDSGGTPATAAEILRQLHAVSSQPVRYLINSHWHWDHWGGNQTVLEAFPGVKIVAQEKTRETMEKIAIPWNAPGLERDLPGYIEFQKKKLAEAEEKNSPQAAHLRELVRADEDFLQQKRAVHYTFPTVTFRDQYGIALGGRQIEVRHARGITPSDTYAYLPKEKILITGDLVVAPIPFAVGGSYPADWIATLQQFAAQAPKVVIPGHGEAENDRSYLESSLKLMTAVRDDVKAAKAKGMSLEEVLKQTGGDAPRYAAIIGVQEDSLPTFQGYFLDVFTRRAYRELEHPLGDEPVSKD